ncbi:GGDEF domain-containing protein [Deinococcus sp. RIT780]|uniref:GGDEF domain-containing protein n=1 Tax=Deinococcus sp. RIT780 TaxID=2870472 RepID=UPI001C891D30|nr:GGDEF domain-containing protein [Deinococcus sp. RIT780]
MPRHAFHRADPAFSLGAGLLAAVVVAALPPVAQNLNLTMFSAGLVRAACLIMVLNAALCAPRPRASAFRWLLAALTAYCAGEILFFHVEAPGPRAGWVPRASDLCFLLLYPLTLRALLDLSGARASPPALQIDVAAVTLTLTLPLLLPLSRAGHATAWIQAIFPVLDLWLLLITGWLLLARTRQLRLHQLLLATAVLLIGLGDLWYVGRVAAGDYLNLRPVLHLWNATFALIALSALLALDPDDRVLLRARPLPPRLRSLLSFWPFLALLGAFVSGWALRGTSQGGAVHMTVTLLIAALLTARYRLLVTRQLRLLERLRETSRALGRSRADLHRQLHTDDLTGLPNRRALMDTLARWADPAPAGTRNGAAREPGAATGGAADRGAADRGAADEGVGVIFLDLNGFKAVNDHHGHAAGDLVLREVARRLRGALLRPDDLAARLSGDEFAVAFRGPPDHGEALLRAVGAVITGTPVSGPGLPPDLRVGVSAGLAHSITGPRTLSPLLSSADHRMYLAKRGGSGLFRSWPTTDESPLPGSDSGR